MVAEADGPGGILSEWLQRVETDFYIVLGTESSPALVRWSGKDYLFYKQIVQRSVIQQIALIAVRVGLSINLVDIQ